MTAVLLDRDVRQKTNLKPADGLGRRPAQESLWLGAVSAAPEVHLKGGA